MGNKEKITQVESGSKRVNLEGLEKKVLQDFDKKLLKSSEYTELIKKRISLSENKQDWLKNPDKTLKSLKKYLVAGCELEAKVALLVRTKASEQKSDWYKVNSKQAILEAFDLYSNYSSNSNFEKILLATPKIAKKLQGGVLTDQANVIRRLDNLNIDNLLNLRLRDISNLSNENKKLVLQEILKEQNNNSEFEETARVYIEALSNNKTPKSVLSLIDRFIARKINELRAYKAVTSNTKSFLSNFSRWGFGENSLDTKNELDLDPKKGVDNTKHVMGLLKDSGGWAIEKFKEAPAPLKIITGLAAIWGVRFTAGILNSYKKGAEGKGEEDLSTLAKLGRFATKAALAVAFVWGGSEIYKKYAKEDSEHFNSYFSTRDVAVFFGLENTKGNQEKAHAFLDAVFYDDVLFNKKLSTVENAYSKSSKASDLNWRNLIRNSEHLDKSDKYSPENGREGVGLVIRRYSPKFKNDKLSIYNNKNISKESKSRIEKVWKASLLNGDEWRNVVVTCMAYDEEFAKGDSVKQYHEVEAQLNEYAEYEGKVMELEIEHGINKIGVTAKGIITWSGKPIEKAQSIREKALANAKSERPVNKAQSILHGALAKGNTAAKKAGEIYMDKNPGKDRRYLMIEDLKQYMKSDKLTIDNFPYNKTFLSAFKYLSKYSKRGLAHTSDLFNDDDRLSSKVQFEEYKKNKEGTKLNVIPKKISIYTSDVDLDKGTKVDLIGVNSKMVYKKSVKDFWEEFDVQYGFSYEKSVPKDQIDFYKHSSGEPMMVDFPRNVRLVAKKKVNLEGVSFYGQHIDFIDPESKS